MVFISYRHYIVLLLMANNQSQAIGQPVLARARQFTHTENTKFQICMARNPFSSLSKKYKSR